MKFSDYKTPSKPFVVRHQNDNEGRYDKYFATRQKAADYCYKIGLNNVFDVGVIIGKHSVWYNCTHLIKLLNEKQEQEERMKGLVNEVKKWKNGIADIDIFRS